MISFKILNRFYIVWLIVITTDNPNSANNLALKHGVSANLELHKGHTWKFKLQNAPVSGIHGYVFYDSKWLKLNEICIH